MYPIRSRLNVEHMNKTNSLEIADIECMSSDPILSIPDQYDLTVEKAEIPISVIPLDYIDTPLNLIIDYPPGSPAHPVLQEGENYYKIEGMYRSVDEILEKVNKIINGDLQPALSCGSFGFKRLDDRKSRIMYKFGDAADLNAISLGVDVYFDSELKYLLDDIPGLYQQMPPGYLGEDTLTLFKLDFVGFLGGSSTVVLKEQPFYLINRFYGFKSIRIFSSLPTIPYYIYDQDNYRLSKTNMITEIILNSEEYREGQKNSIYIPTAFRFTQLTGIQAIDSFKVWFYVHYKNGKDYRLEIDKKEYISLTLAFAKRDNQPF